MKNLKLGLFALIVILVATPLLASAEMFEVPYYTGADHEPNFEYRTWMLNRDVAGYDREFEAAFVGLAGLDTDNTTLYIVFMLPDGTKRALPMDLFSGYDQTEAFYAHEELQKRREMGRFDIGEYIAPELPPATGVFEVGTPFMDDPRDYEPKTEELMVDTSKYFRFLSGKYSRLSGYRWFEEEFREMNLEYFDTIFDFATHELGFPAPYSDEGEKIKIDVTLLGTGIGDADNEAGSQIWISPENMLQSSMVPVQLIANVFQYYSGGFRDNNSDWYWSTHANWFAHQFRPDVIPEITTYNERPNHYLTSPRLNGGAWPFIQTITENPQLGPLYPNLIWIESLRENPTDVRRLQGTGLEDPIQTLMRLGYEHGIFTHPEKGFGDVIGEMAARNVAWDYVFNYVYKNTATPNRFNRVVLEEVPDKPGWYMSPYALAPQQYGYNIVQLVPEEGATAIEVDFQGIKVEEGADWRVTIVAVDNRGWSRYSTMWNEGVNRFELAPEDKEIYLAIAATPSVYRPINIDEDFHNIMLYPYEVKVTGATPIRHLPDYLNVSHLFGIMGQAHPNGGGFVARTARVEDTVYVGENAVVFGSARVSGNARVEDYAVVMDAARVRDNAIIAGNAVVRDSARIEGNALVRDALVRGQVTISDSARVLDGIYVEGSGYVNGNATLKGRGYVQTSFSTSRATISGDTIIGFNSAFSPWTTEPITTGIYVDLTEDEEDSRGSANFVYAHWDFARPNEAVLFDTVYRNDGLLRGTPKFTTDGSRTVLELNGADQYVLLGKDITEFADVEIELTVKWFGGDHGQRIFDFSRDENQGMYLTPSNADGKLEYAITTEGATQKIVGTKALPVNQWVTIVLEIKDGQATLKVDGEVVGTITDLASNPQSLRTKANYLGRDFAGTTFFSGQYDDVKVSRIPVAN
ncbi:MAG: hypothetical protein GX020_05455 [Firmicutes bacterium]|nr:hypothetical protein [Bacillota bacterium]